MTENRLIRNVTNYFYESRERNDVRLELVVLGPFPRRDRGASHESFALVRPRRRGFERGTRNYS